VLTSRHEHPFRYFTSSPEVIRLVVMMYVCDTRWRRNLDWHLSRQRSPFLITKMMLLTENKLRFAGDATRLRDG
jgi:hypothetical protein